MLNSNLLRKLDMQDLMVFVAVYDQSSVTDVSETLFVSQSTVSYSLKKLRTSFEDELFINTRAGMRPTYKAATMYGHVQKILESINLCHAGSQAFDPTQKAVTFNVCAPEYFEQLILPRLLKNFDHADLPVIVNVQKLETEIPADALRDGRLDLVICFGPHFHREHKDIKTQMLLEDDLVCVSVWLSEWCKPARSCCVVAGARWICLTGISFARRCLPKCRWTARYGTKKSSARCCACAALPVKPRRWRWPMTASLAWWPAC